MKKKEKNDQTQISLAALDRDFQNVNGKIPYNMTNDYMFRAVLQSNNKVLRGLICSLLHLAESEVNAVEITNPIILGETVNDKEFRLDSISAFWTIRCLMSIRSFMHPTSMRGR